MSGPRKSGRIGGPVLLAGAAFALSSTLALAAPESLLPPMFSDPAPTPAPAPAPTPRPSPAPAPAPAPRAAPAPTPAPTAAPGQPSTLPGSAARAQPLPTTLPSLRELEAMDEDELNELFGLRPQYDLPPSARRAMRRVGVVAVAEGGFPGGVLAAQPAALVHAALEGTQRPPVSRWAHILLRRTLASRLDAPAGMDPATFAALRARLLNRLGEGAVARELVQDVDSDNYSPALAAAALDAYLMTGDILGMCPVAQLRGELLDTAEWEMTRSLCRAYSGNPREAERQLARMLSRDQAPRIDVLLAQRYAGAAGEGRRAVTIEWNGVDALTPWRFGLARALGVELPARLRDNAAARYDFADALTPAVSLPERAGAADRAAARGVLSAGAMVDLYSQIWADPAIEAGERERASTLRTAYVGQDAAARLAAMRRLWDDVAGGADGHGRQVLTAYAAARMPVSEALADEAPMLIVSMLTAGLDRNAMRWAPLATDGGLAWALLALAQPAAGAAVDSAAVTSFIDADESPARRKSRFLVAGLAGLGRIDDGQARSLASGLGLNLSRESAWSERIDRAGELGNPALVALLAGLGMQAESWETMSARHLFHIVRALDRAGLNAEARMIAAEAVARG